jgi:Family of unknown function (DUF5343)
MVAGTTNRTAPYSRFGAIEKVIERIRGRGLPSPLTSGALEDMGLASGNGYQILQGLRFLKLVAADGTLTDAYDALRGATTEQFKPELAVIIHKAYEHIFTIIDPAKDDIVAINDAFRRYDPPGQRSRMVYLFMGLCRMAGLAPEEAVRKRVPRKPHQASVGRIPRQKPTKAKLQEQPPLLGLNHDDEVTNGTVKPEAETTKLPLLPPQEEDDSDYRLMFELMIRKLPKGERQWTRARREQWMLAMGANLDMVVEVIEE